MEVLVITGMSGAGRTQATKILEDCGYFCIDNLPFQLLPKFVEMFRKNEIQTDKLALAIDIRSGDFYEPLMSFKKEMSSEGFQVKILFLDCEDDVLISRYSQNRRLHPLAGDGDNATGIKKEREMLKELRGHSDYYVNTTEYSIWDLKKNLFELFKENSGARSLKVNIISFGYKYGLPLQSDLVMDVRFLPNPYYRPELRNLTGNDSRIVDYLLGFEETKTFIEKYMDILEMIMPMYSETREVLVIAIGCTGGKHRSVMIANELAKRISEMGYRVSITHRDLVNS